MNNSALKLFHELMKKGWIDRNDNSLMWNLVEDNEARDELDQMGIELGFEIIQAQDRIYMVPTQDNDLFLKNNVDYRADIKATNEVRSRDLYLMNYLAIYILFIFFKGEGVDALTRDFTTNGVMPQYIFTSPERISSDGYLEYALNKRRDDIGLVVVDEAHCISQWGDGFRPAYRNIPDFLDRIFGRDGWPATLCLTATLNEEQQQQVIKDFHISNVVKGENLWRKNLYLEILNLKDGKEDTKDEELERIIEKHRGEKILVFAHRVYGKHPTTRTLYDKYKDVYEGVAYFDSKADDKYKAYVLEGFKNGDIKIVFATSAFGMGVDIPDIRVVVNYLISETVEQYYQEVGRGGRDNQPAYGYLLYTNQSKRGRRMLLNQSLCTEADLVSLYEDRKPKGDVAFGHVSYEDMNEEQRIAFALLLEYGVFSVIAKGLASTRCLDSITEEGQSFLDSIKQYARNGSTTVAAKKSGKNINSMILNIWELCVNRALRMSKAPDRSIFYVQERKLDDELKAEIISDQEKKKVHRVAKFEEFVSSIEAGDSAEMLVRKALNIGE